MKPLTSLILLFAVLAVITTQPGIRKNSWNDGSRMATIQSLVERHTFIIDESEFADTGDKVFINGHFYSDKPAMASVLGALIYFPLFHSGIELGKGFNLAYYLITLLMVRLFWIVGLVAFYFVLGFTEIDWKSRIWLTFALGVGSLYFTFSSVFSNHSLAASFLIIGFYWLLKAGQARGVPTCLFLSGLFISLAGAVDNPIGAFYLGFSVYIILQSELRDKFIWYVLPLLLTLVPALYINYAISGTIIPLSIVKSYFIYPGSPWSSHAGDLAGVKINGGKFLITYSLKVFFGTKGFLLYNPLLFIAIPLLIHRIVRKGMFSQEAMVIVFASSVIIVFYLLTTSDYSGYSYSYRRFVPLLPLLFFFVFPFFENVNNSRQRIFSALLTVSVFISSIGCINPWSNLDYSGVPIIANLIELSRIVHKFI